MSVKDDVDSYLETIDRLEADVHATDPGAYGTSIAISLKRIADVLEKREARDAADRAAGIFVYHVSARERGPAGVKVTKP